MISSCITSILTLVVNALPIALKILSHCTGRLRNGRDSTLHGNHPVTTTTTTTKSITASKSTSATHSIQHFTTKHMTLVQPTSPVLHIEAEAIQQDLCVATGTEQDLLDRVSGHSLVRSGILQDHTPVVGQRDREDNWNGLCSFGLLPKDVHLPIRLDLTDGGVNR